MKQTSKDNQDGVGVILSKSEVNKRSKQAIPIPEVINNGCAEVKTGSVSSWASRCYAVRKTLQKWEPAPSPSLVDRCTEIRHAGTATRHLRRAMIRLSRRCAMSLNTKREVYHER